MSPSLLLMLKRPRFVRFGEVRFPIFVTLFLFLSTSLLSASAYAEPVCVVKRNVQLRRGPGKKFSVSWTVPKFMPFEKLEEKNGWYRVSDLEGAKHWIVKSAVSTKKTCLVVRTRTAKLRKGPGKDEPLADLASVDKYTPFLKTDRDGEWVKVQDEYNGSYWVNEVNVWIPMGRTHVSF